MTLSLGYLMATGPWIFRPWTSIFSSITWSLGTRTVKLGMLLKYARSKTPW